MGAAAGLLSCRTQKIVANTDLNAAQSYVDTTKTVADTASHKQTNTDTTKNRVAYEGVGVIEFVEGGGKVSIDKAGNVTFDGVKNVKGQHKGSIAQDKGISQKTEETAGHSEQLNGVKADQSQREKRTEEKTPARKWYETTFARIGQGVCIAAILWLLFLYLKRKK